MLPEDQVVYSAPSFPDPAARSAEAPRIHRLDAADSRGLAIFAQRWPRGRQLSDQLADWHCGGVPALFETLSTPNYLLGGGCFRDDAWVAQGWMVLVRHHERQGYAGTARLIFDLDPRAPPGCIQALFRQCLDVPGASRLRVIIGFSDARSPAVSQAFTALHFLPMGALSLGSIDSAHLQVHAREMAA